MNLQLTDRVALVAAASRGLGRAIAQALADEGATVAIAARHREALDETAHQIAGASGRRVLPVVADVTIPEDVERLVATVERELGCVDVLVNNAGGPRPGVFTDMRDEDWLGAIELNLMSTIRLTRLVLPGMRRRRWGRIINMTGVAVKQPMDNLILSNTARTGVVAMAKTLAGQVAAEGITVNNVCPGYMLTDRVRQLAAATAERFGGTSDEVIAEWQQAIPAGRLGRPEELAALVTFLASEQAAYLTGTTIQMDGGMVKGLL
jgi:3-oxoacyl-[acyl-carrier protein] reductase